MVVVASWPAVPPAPGVAADVATVQEFLYSVTGAGRAIPVGVASAALDRLAVWAAQAEAETAETVWHDDYWRTRVPAVLLEMESRLMAAIRERDETLRGAITPGTAAKELCRANIELHAINAQVVARAVAAEEERDEVLASMHNDDEKRGK